MVTTKLFNFDWLTLAKRKVKEKKGTDRGILDYSRSDPQMATKKEYHTTVALFATKIEGVLAKIESDPACKSLMSINLI